MLRLPPQKHSPYNIHAAIPMRSCNQRFKNRIELRTQEQPLLGKRIGGTIRAWNDPSRTAQRRYLSLPAAATLDGNTRFRAPASSKHSACNIYAAIPMRSCNQKFKNCSKQEQPLVAKHIGGTMKRPQPHPPHRRGTFFRRLQPLYLHEKHTVSCSGFLPKT